LTYCEKEKNNMLYSRFYFKKKTKVHSFLYFLALILLFFSFLVYVVKLPKQTTILQKKLLSFKIVNLGSQQAGIYWETTDKENTWLNLFSKDTKAKQKFFEETDGNDKNNLKKQHYILLSHLKPNSIYTVSIESDKGVYLDLQNKEYVFRTPASISRPVFTNPLYGKLMQSNGEPSVGSNVLISIDSSYPLFTITKNSGEWLIPLSSLVSKTTGEYFDVDNEMKIDVLFFDSEKKTSITTSLKQFFLLSQSITLGNKYDLSETENVLSATSVRSSSDDILKTISILYPRENALIPAQKPLIKGKGIVGADIYAYINSKPQYSFRTKVDSEGFWMISPQEPLQPGNYVLSLNTKDENGNRVNLMRHFIISKNGEQVLGTATAEPTLITPSPHPTVISPTSITPTVSATVSPLTPTIIITPIITPAITLYSSPTTIPTVAGVYATAVPTPPTTGQNNTLFFMFSFILLISGGLLLFLF